MKWLWTARNMMHWVGGLVWRFWVFVFGWRNIESQSLGGALLFKWTTLCRSDYIASRWIWAKMRVCCLSSSVDFLFRPAPPLFDPAVNSWGYAPNSSTQTRWSSVSTACMALAKKLLSANSGTWSGIDYINMSWYQLAFPISNPHLWSTERQNGPVHHPSSHQNSWVGASYMLHLGTMGRVCLEIRHICTPPFTHFSWEYNKTPRIFGDTSTLKHYKPEKSHEITGMIGDTHIGIDTVYIWMYMSKWSIHCSPTLWCVIWSFFAGSGIGISTPKPGL